jgi:choline dehydrogenase
VPRAGLRFDVVVLGGGAAGCVLAARLSENPDRTVCLVEAGPDYGHFVDDGWPADLRDARALAFSHSWEADPPDDRSQLRARVIGGCSAHNACVAIRGAPVDYEWSDDWTYTTIEPFLARAEQQLGVRTPREVDLSPWQRAFLEAARDLEPFRASPHPVNVRGAFTRWHAGFAYLDDARHRPNLTILDRAVADRVLRAGGAVTHARVIREGAPLDLEAGAVILACGAYGSPLVLQRSGIGPAAELDRLGVPLAADLPVGEGLIDHPGVGLAWKATSRLEHDMEAFAHKRAVFSAQVTVMAQSSSCEPDCWDVFLFPSVEPGAAPKSWDVTAAAFAMKPRSRGRVRARTTDPERPPEIAHGFLVDPADALPIVEGAYLLRQIAESEHVRPYAARELRPGPKAHLGRYVEQSVRGFFHPVGTCALGRVCDDHGRVHGFGNLHVADASFIPDIPRANTHLTTLAVAERLAERM